MIKTGDSLTKEVTLSFDEDPKSVFVIRQLNFADLNNVEKETGAPPNKAFALTPTKNVKNKDGEDVSVYDFAQSSDNDFFEIVSFSARRDLAIVKSGLVSIDGNQVNPDLVVKWLNTIKPASDVDKIVRELSDNIWKFSNEDPKA
jgi:hypothetical protein